MKEPIGAQENIMFFYAAPIMGHINNNVKQAKKHQ